MKVLALSVLLFACTSQGEAGPVMPTNQAPLQASNGAWSVQLVDEWGRSLPTFASRGGTWVEGVFNQRYNVQVTNHSGARIEAVVTVDGRDVLSGKSGDWRNQRGYVINPYDSVTIEGFRTSMSAVAAFRFTSPGDSYSARMGSAQHLGVVGVAVFAERHRPPPPPPVAVFAPEGADERSSPKAGLGSRRAPAGPMGQAEPSPAKPNNLGTRYGEQRYSAVSETAFERATEAPNTVLAVYYDDRAGLMRRGIIAAPPPPPPGPSPFPDSPGQFAPPPR